jgi:hypothetical protein
VTRTTAFIWVTTVVFDALLGREADYLRQNSVGCFDVGQPDDFALSNRVERNTLASPDNLRMGRNCCPHRHVVLRTQGSSDDNQRRSLSQRHSDHDALDFVSDALPCPSRHWHKAE